MMEYMCGCSRGPTLNTSSYSAVRLPSSVLPVPFMTVNSPSHFLSLFSHSISETNVPRTSMGFFCPYANSFLFGLRDTHFTPSFLSISHVALSVMLQVAPECRALCVTRKMSLSIATVASLFRLPVRCCSSSNTVISLSFPFWLVFVDSIHLCVI